jgi:hypothetical protein
VPQYNACGIGNTDNVTVQRFYEYWDRPAFVTITIMTEDETSKKLERIIVEALQTPMAHPDPSAALRELIVICQSLNERIGRLENQQHRAPENRGGSSPMSRG